MSLARSPLAPAMASLAFAASLLGCAGTTPAPSPPPALGETVSLGWQEDFWGFDLLGEAVLSHQETVAGVPVGGLSGLAYDPELDVYYAVSDDPAARGPARFYTLAIDTSGAAFDSSRIEVVGVTEILDRDGIAFAASSLDLESIALTAERTLLISSEGQADRGVQPFIREYALDGSLLREYPVPEKFLVNAERNTGIRHNLGFESLAVSAADNWFYTATENALRQDGPTADVNVGSPARVLLIDRATGRPGAEYVYPVEPVGENPVSERDFRTRGLVELEVLDATHLLALERSYTQGIGNDVELFLISTAEATDVSGWESLEGRRFRPVEKTLLFPMSALGLELDNLEGVAFGPQLPDGRRTLVLVADNNFNPAQRTQVLAFALEDGPRTPSRIQGTGHRSPLEGAWVRGVQGTVTARAARGNGFWLQGNSDGDEATSDALLVVPLLEDATAQPGDLVLAAGLVEETGRGEELTVTRLASARFEILEQGVPLPAAVEIGGGVTEAARALPSLVDDDEMTSFDPAQDALDFFESLEGMRVSISNSTVVGPTSRFGEIAVIDERDLTSETIRSSAGGLVATGAEGKRPPLLLAPQQGIVAPDAAVGDSFDQPIVGVLDYAFGSFRLLAEAIPAPVQRVLETPQSLPLGILRDQAHSLSVASFNVENLSAHSEPEKFARLAEIVVETLGSPDIVALQEIQDDSGPLDDGVVSAEATLGLLTAAIVRAGGSEYRHLNIDPRDGADGGQPGANIRVAYLYRPDRVDFVNRGIPTASSGAEWLTDERGVFLSPNPARIDPQHPAFSEDPGRSRSGSRKPLAAEFDFGGRRIFVINVHLRSKRGDSPIYGSRQPPARDTEGLRLAESMVIRDFLDRLLELDPKAAAIVLGDFNEHPYRAPIEIFHESGFVNAIEAVPAPERYTYIFRGVSQVLDNALSSRGLASSSDIEIEIAHTNSVRPASVRASDHDPILLHLVLHETSPSDG